MTKKFRPKLTASILQWALVDVAGMLLVALAGFYLIKDQTFIPGFPSATSEAIAVALVGIGLIFMAAVKMLAEVMGQMPTAGQDSSAEEK
ncbi:MAG: DUF1418 family protein [Zoogloeaceae bacterium]|nr:DUF1418 family protein [Zoogloeaceae bacterium]